MDYLNYSEKLEYLKYCIQSRSATTVQTLTLKLGVSRRTVLRMVDYLRQKGVDIQFCKRSKTYFLE